MKHKSLLTTLLLSAVSLSAAAVHVPTLQLDSVVNDYVYEKIKEVFSVDETGQHQVRRIYLWERNSDRWIGYETYEHTVNDKGLVLDYTYYRGSTENDNWYKISKIDYTYNMLGKRTQLVEYTWNGQGWENGSKYESAYNEKGQITKYVSFEWNEWSAEWVFNQKTNYTYDKNYQETSWRRYDWNITSKQWESEVEEATRYDGQGRELEVTVMYSTPSTYLDRQNTRTVNTYDDTRHTTVKTAYIWDVETSQWKPNWQLFYTYDQKGNTTSYVYYTGSDSVHDFGLKYEYEYREDGKKTRLLQYNQDVDAGIWKQTHDTQYTYDAFGNKTVEINYYWSEYDNQWIGSSKKLTTFDENHYVNELCAYGSEVRISSDGQVLTSFNGPVPTAYMEYGWDWEANDWHPIPEIFHAIPLFTLHRTGTPEIDNKLQVFLDPLGNILYVDDKEVSLLGSSQEKPVRVFDVSGGLQILSSARIINVSELPSGLYFVTVNGQTRRVMKR